MGHGGWQLAAANQQQANLTRILHSDIIECLADKHSRQNIDLVNRFPLLTAVDENVMLGSFSWYYVKSHRKEVLRQYALDFGKTIVTPSELARTYLQLKYPRQKAMSEQIAKFKQHISAPLYAKPQRYEQGVYIDIRSAYWQILQIVGWDADYNSGVWLGRGQPMDDFPYADIKLSRNCLITAGLPSEASFWEAKQKRFKSISTYNRSANLGIWSLVMEILHGVAWDCIAAGACYAHTDGYICDRSRVEAVRGAIAEWGLEARIKKSGETQVYGVGSYTIGNQSTKNPHIADHHYDGLILSPHRAWLKRKVSFFAERTNFKWQSDWTPEK